MAFFANSLYLTILIYVLSFKLIQSQVKSPSILLSINARNEEYTLPTFFGYIDRLNYPKDRISILIQTDHNEDDTAKVINEWVTKTKSFYHKISVRHDAHPTSYSDSDGPCDWSLSRYTKILQNRQIALEEARNQWADYLFQVNADNFLLDPNVLKDLISEKKPIVAPMLVLFDETSGYSNFWGGVDERGYYKRVPEYFEILKRRQIGTFEVPMIHSTYLIDMRDKKMDFVQHYPVHPTYYGDTDDILIFAWSVKQAGLTMHICNKNQYGFMMGPYTSTMTLRERHQMFTDSFIDYVAYFPPLVRSVHIDHKFPVATKKGFDEVFMINLVRRPDRRIKMELSFKELGIDYKYFPAVDGRNYTSEKLRELGIKAMADFKDPYLERPLTFGEIGCFMSHWNIWLEIVDRNLEMVLVLEDDIRFEPDFNKKLDDLMAEARGLLDSGVEWDIIYVGRKPLIYDGSETFVQGCRTLVWCGYSYWTLGYVIRLSGARKLVAGAPLSKMIPVDEYIPIMFDEHFDPELKSKFFPREMVGMSAEPLLIYPTHYVGDPGYISDTEYTLSFEGKDVSKFRSVKEIEREKDKARRLEEQKLAEEERKKDPNYVPEEEREDGDNGEAGEGEQTGEGQYGEHTEETSANSSDSIDELKNPDLSMTTTVSEDKVLTEELYVGRKPLILDKPEVFVSGCKKIVWAKYSYWTLGYIIRLSGAKRLVEGDPLGKMIPVDEYIPIMFNEHTDDQLLRKFGPREMIGFSAAPLLLFPTHYIGDPGYFSDTEDTLSFEGKDVTMFRAKKQKEREQELLNSKAEQESAKKENQLHEKTEGDIKPNELLHTVASKSQAEHGEL